MHTAKLPRLQGIDGLRAVAITAVVIFHAEPGVLPGGFLGVDLFFVISGFLITRQLLAEVAGEGGLDLIGFYRRRMHRLFPPMLAMLAAVTVGAVLCWPDEVATLRGDLPAALAYVANWHQVLAHRSYFQTSGRPSPLQHLWSLAIEEQFYLLWPVLLLLAVKTKPRRVRRNRPAPAPHQRDAGRVAVLAVLGAAASTAWMWVLAVRGDVPFGSDSSRLYFGSDTHAAGLLVGAALAAVTARRRIDLRSPSPVFTVAGFLALATLGWSFRSVSEFSPGLYRGGFLVTAGLSAVLVMAAAQGGWFTRALELPLLRYLGTRSYAIYLWHWPVIVVTRPGLDLDWPAPLFLLVRLFVPVLLAEASYRLLEHRSRRVERVLSSLAYLPWRLVALPVAVAALLAVTVIPGRSSAATVRVSVAAPISVIRTTPLRLPGETVTPIRAVLPLSTAPLGRVLAVGDSVLLGAAPALHTDLRLLTVDAVVGRQARPTLLVVDRTRPLPAAVVISTGNNGVIDPMDLEKTLRLLKNRRVVIVTDNVPRDWQDPNNRILRAAVKRHPGAVLLDWLALSKDHADWFYDDGFHVRPAGATAYANGITRALHQATPIL